MAVYKGTKLVAGRGGGKNTNDHNLLTNRDANDQHPISAITDLQDTLDEKANDNSVVKTVNNHAPVDGNVDVTSITFTYEQGVASDTWVITHNLNKYPSVSVTDSAGSTIECSVTYNDTNTCTLKMNGEFKGTAYLN